MGSAKASSESLQVEDDFALLEKSIDAAFFIKCVESTILRPLSAVMEGFSAPFDLLAIAFKSNVNGLYATVSIPFQFAFRSIQNQHEQRIFIAEKIRARSIDAEANESIEALDLRRYAAARIKADAELTTFFKSKDGLDVITRQVYSWLKSVHSDPSLANAARELLLQGVVLCWSAFEVAARDCFIALLNAKPTLVSALYGDPMAKRRFELSKISLDTLAHYQFDLSLKMGALLSQQQDFSDYVSIKTMYAALFPSDLSIRDIFGEEDLRLLSQRRNLIVHKRAVIDEVYIKTVNCPQEIGAPLAIAPRDLVLHLESVVRATAAILSAAARSLELTTKMRASSD
jgi:hypothetical protein